MGFELVGSVWDREAWREYIAALAPSTFAWADSITVHHTASPSLAQRPQGWKIQHMRNLKHFYGKELGWGSGPHLFTDEDQVFGLSSLYRRGVHARSFNSHSIGIEALGNYDFEPCEHGRGEEVWRMTAFVVAVLLKRMGLQPTEETVLFHRDDPKTSKTCPGKLVEKEWFLDMVKGHSDRADEIPVLNPEPIAPNLRADLSEVLDSHHVPK